VETSLAKLNEKLGIKPVINYETFRKTQIAVTPVQRDSPYLKNVLYHKSNESERVEEKKSYSEIEEIDRLKKRQRAEQILLLNYETEVLDSELSGNPSTSNNTSNNGPYVEKL